MNQTTEKDFKLFKKEAEYWIERFQLRTWEIKFTHDGAAEVPEGIAWCSSVWPGRVAVLGLSVNWEHQEVNNKEVCRTAFHEVCELLLRRLYIIGSIDAKQSEIQELEEQNHIVIRVLEHSVWLPDWTKRQKKRKKR